MIEKIFIDLTHTLENEIPSWDGDCGFKYSILSDYDEEFCTHSISMKAGVGTHMDAPAHCVAGGKTIDAFTLNELIAPCIVIDFSKGETIESFEKMHGKILKGSFVLIRTGWDRYWKDPVKYQNNFPTVSKEAAELLLARDIAGLGVDTLSPDAREGDFPVHKIFLGAGKVLIENVANSDQLPPIGCTLFVLPLKIKAGTEAPIRLIARFDKLQT